MRARSEDCGAGVAKSRIISLFQLVVIVLTIRRTDGPRLMTPLPPICCIIRNFARDIRRLRELRRDESLLRTVNKLKVSIHLTNMKG